VEFVATPEAIMLEHPESLSQALGV